MPSMIVSISSDVLYPPSEQLELASHMPNAQHHMIESPEGHDGFILETTKISVPSLLDYSKIATGNNSGSE